MRLAPGDPLDRNTSVDGVPRSGIVKKTPIDAREGSQKSANGCAISARLALFETLPLNGDKRCRRRHTLISSRIGWASRLQHGILKGVAL